MRYAGGRRRRVPLKPLLVFCGVFVTGLGLLMLQLKSLDFEFRASNNGSSSQDMAAASWRAAGTTVKKPCLTVEEMGKDFRRGVGKESLRVRTIIEKHFVANGTFEILA